MQLSLQSLRAGSKKDYGLRSTDWKNGVTKSDYVLAATTLVLVTMISVTEVPATAALVTDNGADAACGGCDEGLGGVSVIITCWENCRLRWCVNRKNSGLQNR